MKVCTVFISIFIFIGLGAAGCKLNREIKGEANPTSTPKMPGSPAVIDLIGIISPSSSDSQSPKFDINISNSDQIIEIKSYQVQIWDSQGVMIFDWIDFEVDQTVTLPPMDTFKSYYAKIRIEHTDGSYSNEIQTPLWIPKSGCFDDMITDAPFANSSSGGDGLSASTAFIICTKEQLASLAADINSWDKYFILDADINLASYTGNSFPVIGNITNKFTGTFDGGNHVISNLVHNLPAQSHLGLFGYLNNGTITNLEIRNFNITGDDYVAALVGYGQGGSILTNITTSGTIVVTGDQRVGGVAGYFGDNISSEFNNITVESVNITATDRSGGVFGEISRTGAGINNISVNSSVVECGSRCGGVGSYFYRGGGSGITGNYNVTCNSVSGAYCGGIFAIMDDTIHNVSAQVTVTASSRCIGGLFALGSYTRSHNQIHLTGTVSAPGQDDVGGIVGGCGSDPRHFYNTSFTGDVIGRNNVGGLSGYGYQMSFYNSYFKGSVTGNDRVGGIWGSFTDDTTASLSYLNNSYAIATVTGNDRVGGFAGYTSNVDPQMVNNFFLGTINGSSNVGGIFGYSGENTSGYTNIQSNYWAITGGGGSPTNSIGDSAVVGSTGNIVGEYEKKTEADFLIESTFNLFDFTSLWEFNGINPYPVHK